MQTDLKIYTETDRHTKIQTDIQTYTQTDKYYIETYIKIYTETNILLDIQTDKYSDRHTDRHTARHTGRLIEVDTYSAAGKAFSSLVRVLSLFSANPVLSSDF